MSDISKIDKNFVIDTNIGKDDICFYNVKEAPFKIYGVSWKDGKYRRMPADIAKGISSEVYRLHARTAGGRVRFVTDSKYIAINTITGDPVRVSHFTLAGTTGFDMYVGNEYVKTFAPPYDMDHSYSGIMDFDTSEMREITINFPLYSEVQELYVGLQKNAEIKEASQYKSEKPIVYYGSSITMGGCASRPGRCYQNIVARELKYDYMNLGFSGSALAEDKMTEYMKGLEMSAFVYDYDHNAPTPEYLQSTHEKMFCGVREAHPDIPIIIMARPKKKLTEAEKKRSKIIETTYRNAIARGDNKVAFIDGSMLTSMCADEGTIDGTHPTDFGFASMASAVGKVLKEMLEVVYEKNN